MQKLSVQKLKRKPLNWLIAFGLGAAVFTRDIQRGEEIATKYLEAACCFGNAFVKSDPRLPFGGIR